MDKKTDVQTDMKMKIKTSRALKRIKRKDPDARIADIKDGLKMLLLPVIIGVVLITAGVLGFLLSSIGINAEKDFFDNAKTIDGTVSGIKPQDNNSSFDVDYRYRYENTTYENSERISSDMAKILELTGKDEDAGKTILVYIDPQSPDRSGLEYKTGTPLYFLLLPALAGIAVIAYGAVRCVQCKNGKMIVFKDKKGTKLVKIK